MSSPDPGRSVGGETRGTQHTTQALGQVSETTVADGSQLTLTLTLEGSGNAGLVAYEVMV